MASKRTERRDKERTLEQLNVLLPARELERFGQRYPRFKEQVDKLVAFIRAQNQSSHVKQKQILRSLSTPQELSEICEETNLDRVSVKTELGRLMQRNNVEMRDRDGNAIVLRANGRPTRTPVYRLGPSHPSSNPRGGSVLGSSQTSARHR